MYLGSKDQLTSWTPQDIKHHRVLYHCDKSLLKDHMSNFNWHTRSRETLCWLVVLGHENCFFPIELGISSSQLTHIHQRGRHTTNQYNFLLDLTTSHPSTRYYNCTITYVYVCHDITRLEYITIFTYTCCTLHITYKNIFQPLPWPSRKFVSFPIKNGGSFHSFLCTFTGG